MNKTMLLASAVLVLAACSANGDDDGPAPAAGDPTTTPTTATTGVIGEIPEGPLRPGRYALAPVGPHAAPLAVVDLPAGYHSWAFFIEADEPAGLEDPLMLGLWRLTEVFEDPCAESHPVRPTSVRGIANAFLRQRFTSKTEPREVELAGHHGLYLEVTTPRHLNYYACDDDEVNLWDGRPDSSYWTRMPGLVSRLWILDVDGQPMMLHLAVPPQATDRQVRAMTSIVEGAVFESAVG